MAEYETAHQAWMRRNAQETKQDEEQRAQARLEQEKPESEIFPEHKNKTFLYSLDRTSDLEDPYGPLQDIGMHGPTTAKTIITARFGKCGVRKDSNGSTITVMTRPTKIIGRACSRSYNN